ncbi:hypothetical protein CRUP_033515 [Coryphaenoides rupestris]|nr:hypothetical protein CRUP_033515 [Coryphaenoides rupestris]
MRVETPSGHIDIRQGTAGRLFALRHRHHRRRHHQHSRSSHTIAMQSADLNQSKSSLLLALMRYSAAVKHMEQTVLLPSLLRDVPSEQLWDGEVGRVEEEEAEEDLYQSYLTLKAIKTAVEVGMVRSAAETLSLGPEPLGEAGQEALFHFHLRGLFSVLAHLTEKSQSLTDKYMELIGVAY